MNSEMFLTSNCVGGGRQTNRLRKKKRVAERESGGDTERLSKVPQLEVPNKCQAMKWKLIMQDILCKYMLLQEISFILRVQLSKTIKVLLG